MFPLETNKCSLNKRNGEVMTAMSLGLVTHFLKAGSVVEWLLSAPPQYSACFCTLISTSAGDTFLCRYTEMSIYRNNGEVRNK